MSPLRCYAITDKAAGWRSPVGEGLEDVHEKACSAMTWGARQVAKASEALAAAEVVGNAPNKMNFSEQLGGCQRQGQRRRDGLIKLRLGPSRIDSF
jgi:hypothetical protein